jgi:hypothetical protein
MTIEQLIPDLSSAPASIVTIQTGNEGGPTITGIIEGSTLRLNTPIGHISPDTSTTNISQIRHFDPSSQVLSNYAPYFYTETNMPVGPLQSPMQLQMIPPAQSLIFPPPPIQPGTMSLSTSPQIQSEVLQNSTTNITEQETHRQSQGQ